MYLVFLAIKNLWPSKEEGLPNVGLQDIFSFGNIGNFYYQKSDSDSIWEISFGYSFEFQNYNGTLIQHSILMDQCYPTIFPLKLQS